MKRKPAGTPGKNTPKDDTPPAARKELRQGLKEYEDLFNNLNDAASLFEMRNNGLPGRYLKVNDTLCRWLGYSRKELLTKSPLDISDKLDDTVNSKVASAFAKKGSHIIERTLVAKDGTKIPVEVNFHRIIHKGKPVVLSISRDVSDRKAAEAAQRESEEKFRKTFHVSPDALTVNRLSDGLYVDVNKAFCRLSGYREEEVLGKTSADFKIWNNRDERKNLVRSLQENGIADNFRAWFRMKDGTLQYGSVSAIVFEIGGEPHVMNIIRDLTKEKKAEDALRESEEKFRATVEQSLEGISLIDEKGIILEWNGALESITGVARGTAIGKTLWDVQEMMRKPEERTPERLERGKTNILGSLRHMDSPFVGKHQESVIYRPDGASVDIQQIVYPIKTAIGIRLGSVIRDVTLQKASQKALKQSEELYRALIETTGTGYVVIDDSGRVLDANPEYVRLAGHSDLKDIRGRTVFEWTAPNHQEKNRSAVKQCVHDGSIRNFEVDYVDKNGRITPILINATVAEMDGTRRILTLCRDITDKKRMEENLNKSEKLESLGILAGGIAHDFNNLLTGIFGFIDVARLYNTSGASDKVSVNLTKALDVFNRARALTQQLLTFSKGGLPVKKVLALPQLLTNTTNFVLSGSMVGARFSFPENLWPCEVDENQIGQVIDNIVINARQAMPTGGALVITAENVPRGSPVPAPLAPGDYVKVSVRDSGTGISREYLPRIFDPFFTTKQEGSGLGLATAYSIIKKHEGIIEAESELGTGATFHIYLPALPSAAIETPSSGTKKHRGEGAVLVMDDEDFVRDVAVELLKTMGYSVDTAASGAEAIEKYCAALASPTPYRFCILDLTIPNGMGGKDAVQELLKADPRAAAVAASGYSQDPVMTDPQAFGFRDKIRKPFTKEELGEVLERVTGGK